jgi:hypothetical protein
MDLTIPGHVRRVYRRLSDRYQNPQGLTAPGVEDKLHKATEDPYHRAGALIGPVLDGQGPPKRRVWWMW